MAARTPTPRPLVGVTSDYYAPKTGSPYARINAGYFDAILSAGGLPIGLQIVGRPWAEAAVLRAGHAYEQATDWHRRRPAD